MKLSKAAIMIAALEAQLSEMPSQLQSAMTYGAFSSHGKEEIDCGTCGILSKQPFKVKATNVAVSSSAQSDWVGPFCICS